MRHCRTCRCSPTLTARARRAGLTLQALRKRLLLGWSLVRALATPLQRQMCSECGAVGHNRVSCQEARGG